MSKSKGQNRLLVREGCIGSARDIWRSGIHPGGISHVLRRRPAEEPARPREGTRKGMQRGRLRTAAHKSGRGQAHQRGYAPSRQLACDSPSEKLLRADSPHNLAAEQRRRLCVSDGRATQTPCGGTVMCSARRGPTLSRPEAQSLAIP